MAAERQSRMIERVRERKERHRERHFAFRIGFGIVGALVVLAGIALLVLPGPGWLVIAIGLAMLALEFDPIERLLERVLLRLEDAGEKAKNARPWQKAVGIAATVAVGAGAIAAVLLWDLPLLPV
jgi:uncharacterized protein (TIGR02611 family)